jgi:hypothetical protein
MAAFFSIFYKDKINVGLAAASVSFSFNVSLFKKEVNIDL